ncbi:MAG: haloacid dehalogenase-like hydrolase [Tannerella sp.]|jgi:HAD superfamily hydrolase (TIGR01490 family)|nr:haloacid dehalogenase-like hydrolase [Tannerella sp.]
MKKKTVVAFDFDGTITMKDTLFLFIMFSRGKGRLLLGILLFLPLIAAMKLKIYTNEKVKERLFSYFFKGVSIEKFDDWCRKFSLIIDGILRQKTIEKMHFHKNHGDEILIISASVENWIKPWADKVGVDVVLATKIETDCNGLLTGKFLTKNCTGEEKVNRLTAAFPCRSNYRLVAYGDSRGDKQLIEFADMGYLWQGDSYPRILRK